MPEVEPALWTAPEGTSWSATTCGDTSSVAGSGLTAAPTVVVRRRCDVAAGSVLYHATEPVSFWHRHDMHELQYGARVAATNRSDGFEGAVRIQGEETAERVILHG